MFGFQFNGFHLLLCADCLAVGLVVGWFGNKLFSDRD